jgi:hypothetical protein
MVVVAKVVVEMKKNKIAFVACNLIAGTQSM